MQEHWRKKSDRSEQRTRATRVKTKCLACGVECDLVEFEHAVDAIDGELREEGLVLVRLLARKRVVGIRLRKRVWAATRSNNSECQPPAPFVIGLEPSSTEASARNCRQRNDNESR